jgi:hypothetical protein
MVSPYIVSGLGVPTTIIFPDPLVAGDTWNFRLSTLQWPNSTAEIVFAADGTKLTSTATVVANYFQWLIGGAETSKLIPGPYTYNVFMTDAADGSRYTAERGSVRVAPDISDPNTLVTETTTPLQQMLAACDAALIRLLGQDTSMVQYGGQMYEFQDVEKLFSVRDQLQARVNDEADALRGQKGYRKIACVFTDF